MAKETENWMAFGLWVKLKREAKGWTQEELAKRADFADRQTIYRIEAGASTKRSSVIKIARALGESANEALAIAFGLPKSPESAADLAERKAEIERTAELIDNWKEMSPDEQARALAVIKLFRGEPPVADRGVERLTSQPTHTPSRTPSSTIQSPARKQDKVEKVIEFLFAFTGKPPSDADMQKMREILEEEQGDDSNKSL